MFSPQFANTSRSRQIRAMRSNSSDMGLEASELSAPWAKSSVSLTSTVDSPIMAAKTCSSQLHDAESDDHCQHFHSHGYCPLGSWCTFSHNVSPNISGLSLKLEEYPELIIQAALARRNSFLQ